MSFLSQALASTTNFCTHTMIETPVMNHMLSHTSMTEEMSSPDELMTMMDCCHEECKCSMSGCFTLSLLTDTSFNTENITFTQKIVQLASIHQSQIDASLFRPPIL